jgi:accessory gene regulator protein AgrB
MTIAQVADRIGEHICEQTARESEVKKVCFGVELMLTMAIFIISTLVLGGMMGLFLETGILLAVMMAVKFMIGGNHLSGFLPCLILSTCLVIFGAGTTHFYTHWLSFGAVAVLVIIDLTLLLLFPLHPSYRDFNPRQTFKRKFCTSLLLLFSALIYLNHVNLFCAGLLIGFSIAILTMSPLGASFITRLDKMLQRKGEEV